MAKRRRNKRKRDRSRKYRPYEPVKMKFFQVSDPFGDMPGELRRKAIKEAATAAKQRFETTYPTIGRWFDAHDPLYVLSFCVVYFLASEQGVDKEAVEGKLDFAPHHLELLQAFALMRPRVKLPTPLLARAEELRKAMQSLTDDLGLAQLANVPEDDSEFRKHAVINEMRSQTFAIRNWAYPEQTLAQLKALVSGELDAIIAAEYSGVSACRLIDAVAALAKEADERLNAHIQKLQPMFRASTFDEAYAAYRSSFPEVIEDEAGMRRLFAEMWRSDLASLKSMMMVHSDLFLASIFTFSLDDFVAVYGEESHRAGVQAVLEKWSYRFNELATKDPNHFLYSNPVLARPFINLEDGSFFWALAGIVSHTLPGMLEQIIPNAQRSEYSSARSAYLENAVEALFKNAFPNGQVHRGSQWRRSGAGSTMYENDVLVVIDSTAIVVECKSHLVDAPARRGAEFRLIDTLEDLVVSASDQAQRFVEFLTDNRKVHEFSTKRGAINRVDTTRLVRFIPLSVTYENLGFVGANLKDAVAAGLIEAGHSLVPSICLTDLEVISEVLETQAQRIHYLARRAEIEKTMLYRGDEMDLFAFYLDTAFAIGEAENGGVFLNLAMKSKELDPYFVARADGVVVPKPTLELTQWWKDILQRVEERRGEFWTEIAYALLSVDHDNQKKFQDAFSKQAKQVVAGHTKLKHNWVVCISGTRANRQYAVLGYPYITGDRAERNEMMRHMAADAEGHMKVQGIVVLGVDSRAPRYPYDVLAYLPGHASGSPDVAPLLRSTGKQAESER